MASDTATKAFLVLICIVAIGAANSPSKRGQGYQITPKACQVNRVKGICMFVWECIRHDGEHLGMCMDSFMFGSCCLLPDNVTVPTVASDVNAAASSAVSTYISQQTNRPPPSHSNSIYGRPSTKRPYPNRYSSTTPYPSTSKYSTTTFSPPSTSIQKNPFLTTRPPLTSLSLPSTNKYPSTEVSKYPSVADNSVTQSKQPPPEKTTSMWMSSTEPAFITRPKPTMFWSTSIRPRPPDLIPGSINGQRPTRPPKPTPVGSFITKKPTRPSPAQFITSTTVKNPTKPTTVEMKPISIDFITATTKRPTVSPPALLDFVTLSTKKPATILLMGKPTVTTTTTTTSLVNITTSTTTVAPISGQQSTVTLTSVHVPTPKPIKNRKECGVPPLFPRPEMRIVGGNSAPFGGWPWQVSVRRTSFFGFSSTHRCGGAVLNENWIATAGHCVDDLLTSQIRIRVGEYDFSSAGEPLAHEERGVSRKVVHPRYNFFTYEYDLALVQLDRPLDFAPHVAPICLPGSDDLLVGETATVTGWGRLSEGGTLPSVLQEVSVPIVSNENCKSMFLRAGRHEHIPDIFLCAGYEDGGRDSCQGDSGGPLQVRGKDGRYFLAGIISWGIGCAESNLPGVCTRISKFVDWIMENVS